MDSRQALPLGQTASSAVFNSAWLRDALVGAAISGALVGAGILYGELTGTRAAVRPFLISSLLLAAWFGGRSGGIIATVVALAVFALYSADPPGLNLSESDRWFFIAFASAALLIAWFTSRKRAAEQELLQAKEDLEAAVQNNQSLLATTQASEARYHALADSMPQLVWTARSDATVIYYNARAGDYDGIHQADDGSYLWQAIIHPDDVETTFAAWNAAVEREGAFEVEHRIKMRDGSFRWHVSRATHVRQASGELLWYGTATDIEDLRRALAVKDEFLALVSHDLRSPLTTILGNTGILRRHLAISEEDRQQALIDIEERARQLARIIEDLIELARLQSGAQPSLEALNLDRVVRDAVAELQGETRLELLVTTEPAAFTVQANGRYIRQILANFVSNAEKYGAEGNPVEIEVIAFCEGAEVRVSDRGIGVGEATAERLFEPFYRGDSPLGASGGLGIGLTLCKRLVEAQGGRIGAQPREGGGSTFWFRLPLMDEK